MSRSLLLMFSMVVGLTNALVAQTVLNSVQTDQPVVALTFDDGPHPTQTPLLLELFAREKIKVTFFELGQNVVKHPQLARAIHAAGHELANHSNTHRDLGKMSDVALLRTELVDTQTAIKDATGFTPVVFRAPYLAHGPALWTVLAELNLPSIGGTASANDWDAKVTKDHIVEVCSQAGAGDIIILHTWPAKTTQALPEIIARLRAKGLRFVTVSELLALADRPAR